jgi:hypothetical protein
MWAGSEMVAIELAEEFLTRGLAVDLHATSADRAFVRSIFGNAVRLLNSPGEVDLASYDIAYTQHHVFKLILQSTLNREWNAPGPFLVWNHLSPVTPLEAPGSWVEASMADVILCNSPETQAMLMRNGAPFDLARLWPNPAPAAFSQVPLNAPPRTLLTVSNHAIPELDKAIEVLAQQGVSIRRIGQKHLSVRVAPGDIAAAETVVTIGKTVQ